MLLLLLALSGPPAWALPLIGPTDPGDALRVQEDELEALLEEFRVDLDLSRRRGDWAGVQAEVDELLAEDASDWASRAIRPGRTRPGFG